MLRQQPPALRPLFSLHSWLGGRAGTLVWMPRPLGMDTVEVRPPSARHGRAHAPEAAGARVSVSMGRIDRVGCYRPRGRPNRLNCRKFAIRQVLPARHAGCSNRFRHEGVTLVHRSPV